MALTFGVSGDLIVAGYVIVVDLNSVWLDSSVVRAFGIYPEGPGFKSLSGHFYMFNITFLWNFLRQTTSSHGRFPYLCTEKLTKS